MIDKIFDDSLLIAIIIRTQFREDGITFFTENSFSQQLAFMKHPAGKIIQAHVHQPNEREVVHTQEVLVIRKGCVRVDFYTIDKRYLESKVLYSGDVILLAAGGHGFEVLEDLEMFEIKQGPFVGAEDKVRFKGIEREQIKFVQHEESSNVASCDQKKSHHSPYASAGE